MRNRIATVNGQSSIVIFDKIPLIFPWRPLGFFPQFRLKYYRILSIILCYIRSIVHNFYLFYGDSSSFICYSVHFPGLILSASSPTLPRRQRSFSSVRMVVGQAKKWSIFPVATH